MQFDYRSAADAGTIRSVAEVMHLQFLALASWRNSIDTSVKCAADVCELLLGPGRKGPVDVFRITCCNIALCAQLCDVDICILVYTVQ